MYWLRRAAIGYLLGRVDKLYWSSHSASFRLRTSISILYIVLYNYCICCRCLLSALIGGNCWRFIAQAAAIFNATSVCSKLCPLCQQSQSRFDKSPEMARKSEKCHSHMTCAKARGGRVGPTVAIVAPYQWYQQRHETMRPTKKYLQSALLVYYANSLAILYLPYVNVIITKLSGPFLYTYIVDIDIPS